MSRALSESLGWLRRQALSYLLVLAVLVAGSWVFSEHRRAEALDVQAQRSGAVVRQQRAAVAQAGDRVTLADQALAAKLAALRKAHEVAQRELHAKERERDAHRAEHWPWPGLYGPGPLARSRMLDEQVAMLREVARIAQERVDAAAALQASAAGLQRLYEQARGKRAEAERLRGEWHRLSAAHPIAQRFPWTSAATGLDRLKAQVEQLQHEAVQAEQVVAAAARSRELSDWLGGRAALDSAQAALQQAESAHAAVLERLEHNRYRRIRQAVGAFVSDKSRLFLIALLILMGAILSRLLVKLLLYFVVAPLASRRPAVRLLGPYEPRAFAQAGTRGRAGRISAESLTLRLQEHEELLVRPEWLQSSSERSRKRTAWLLSARLPFTSIASGMYLLTRVRAPEGEELVLSPGHDPLDEIALVELPPGAALVCHPRCLGGVVQPRAEPVRISRHWRLGSLHAWLTLQLRFLVFHGPCRLILKGRRGVRMEPAGGGRLIDQGATLGFDACVPYSNVRTETFVPYWMGKDALFNDRFGGIDGAYLYEERPLDRRGNVLVGRGLEGLMDGVLRVFGI